MKTLDEAKDAIIEYDEHRSSDIFLQTAEGEMADKSDRWMPIETATDQDKAPWDGVPVLIYTNHNWGGETNRIHRAKWSNSVHGGDIFGWVVEDLKFGPYSLRGYTIVSHWQPLPSPPTE